MKLTYFIADEIIDAQKFFTNRIYVDFGDYGKYADECTYEELRDYIFCEFQASEDEYGNAEVLVELTTLEELQADRYPYDDEGNVYDYDGDEKIYDAEQGYLTFDDIYYNMVVDKCFTIDRNAKTFTVK